MESHIMGSIDALLTGQELKHLALYESAQGNLEKTIAFLKAATNREDTRNDAEVYMLLGGHFAQIGMMEDAMRNMERALALNPQLEIVRFQLGLMHYFAADYARAEHIWHDLGSAEDARALLHFANGLNALAREDVATAVRLLQAGLNVGHANAPLLVEMQKMLARIESVQSVADSSVSEPESDNDRHVFLSNYGRQTH